MEELLRIVVNIYKQAPVATRWIALIAGMLGVMGLSIAFVRAAYLHQMIRKLRTVFDLLVRPGAGQAAERERKGLDAMWTEMLGFRGPQAFRSLLFRMARARKRPIGLPEEAWRGGYEHVLSAESRWETLVRGIASAAVLVGLLGTVVGFADISADLALVPGTASVRTEPAGNTASKTAPLLPSKLGGVFISTISGIFASLLILLVGAPVLRQAADQWLVVVEDAGRLVIVPLLPRPPADIQDALLEELKRRISTVAEAWESSLRGPAASLAEVAENSRRSAEAVVRAFDGLRVSVEDLKELGNSAKRMREAAQSIEKTAKVYVTASDRLGAAVGSLEATFPALSTDLKSLGERLAGLEGVLASGTHSVTESGDALRNAVTQMGGDFHGLQKAVASRHERESAFLEQTERVVRGMEERLRGLQTVENEIKAEAEQMKVAVSSVAIAIRDSLDPLRESITGAITGTFGKILKDLEDILVGAIRQSDETAKLIERTRLELEDKRQVTASPDAAPTRETTADKEQEFDYVHGRLESLISALNDFSDVLDQSVRSAIVSPPKAKPSPRARGDDGGGQLIRLVPDGVNEPTSIPSPESSLDKPQDQPTSPASLSSLLDKLTSDGSPAETERPPAETRARAEGRDEASTGQKFIHPISTPAAGVTQRGGSPPKEAENPHPIAGEKTEEAIPKRLTLPPRSTYITGYPLGPERRAPPLAKGIPPPKPAPDSSKEKGFLARIKKAFGLRE